MYNIVYSNHRITFGNVNIGFDDPYANITYSTVEHGTVSGVARAQIGSTVTVTATPSADYELAYITVNGTQIEGNSFIVTGNTTVGAVFAAIAYTITYDAVASEHCTLSGPATATAGTSVTVTVTPDSGYGLSYITVNGTQITGRTFTMPSSNVTIVAVMQEYYYFYGTPIVSSVDYRSKLIEPASWRNTSYIPSSITVNDYRGNIAYKTSLTNDTTDLTSIRLENDTGFWIGDNCYNGTTTPTFTFNTHALLYVGNNSLNGGTTQLNITSVRNLNNCTWEIGSNSCTNWNLTLDEDMSLIVGSGSLRTLTIKNNEARITFNGMPGSDQSVIPITIASGYDRCTFNGLTQEMVKPGSTWRKLISYSGSNNFRILCYNMTAETVAWLNNNKYYFIDGNYSKISFSKQD